MKFEYVRKCEDVYCTRYKFLTTAFLHFVAILRHPCELLGTFPWPELHALYYKNKNRGFLPAST